MVAGILPARSINFFGDFVRFTFIIGPLPKSPPNSKSSPAFLPIAGITRTAVVFEFTIPIAASSAIIA